MPTRTIPLLDDDNEPHSSGMVVIVDLAAPVARLMNGKACVLSMLLIEHAGGYLTPADPVSAKHPGSAFEHTVNVFCNRHNAEIREVWKQAKKALNKPKGERETTVYRYPAKGSQPTEH